MGAVLLGDKELERKLKHLSRRGSKRAITAGIRGSMVPIARAMRAAINATAASTDLKREARKAIGARFGKTRRITERHAKVGFSVGKKAKQIRAAYRSKKVDEKGVGISATNVHWFVLGTDERVLKKGSARGPKAGHPTGQIVNVFGDVTRLAMAGSMAASVAAARKKITQAIEREARKKG